MSRPWRIFMGITVLLSALAWMLGEPVVSAAMALFAATFLPRATGKM